MFSDHITDYITFGFFYSEAHQRLPSSPALLPSRGHHQPSTRSMRSMIACLLCVIHFVCILSSQPVLSLDATDFNITESVLHFIRKSSDRTSSTHHSHHAHGTILPIGSYKPCNASTVKLQYKRDQVKESIKYAWDAYVKFAWGYDELRTLKQDGADTFANGLGTTIIDSLPTLYLLGGLDGRYENARDWVATSLDFSKVGRVIVFETVIRILGGLISIFHLSGDTVFLQKAEELGARLAPGFDTRAGLPWPRCFLNETGRCESHLNIGDSLYLAEVGSIQLEYRALAHHTKVPLLKRMRNVTEEILDHLERAESTVARMSGANRALFPFSLSFSTGKWVTNLVTLGAPADSYFEYLVKLWVQGGKREQQYWNRFANVMVGLLEVGSYTTSDGVTIVRDMIPSKDGNITFSHKMDHFSCYIPGMIVLGIDGLPADDVERKDRWLWLAEQLTETCYQMYARSPSGLSGEHIRLNDKDHWRMTGGYELRPEAVEAFFYMYRYTKKEKYRDYAWYVFENIERHCRVEQGGYSPLISARSRRPQLGDTMHSFLISETLQYIYLIFGDDPNELPLDKWVFNTEAHPLLITPGMSDLSTCEAERSSHDEL